SIVGYLPEGTRRQSCGVQHAFGYIDTYRATRWCGRCRIAHDGLSLRENQCGACAPGPRVRPCRCELAVRLRQLSELWGKAGGDGHGSLTVSFDQGRIGLSPPHSFNASTDSMTTYKGGRPSVERPSMSRGGFQRAGV